MPNKKLPNNHDSCNHSPAPYNSEEEKLPSRIKVFFKMLIGWPVWVAVVTLLLISNTIQYNTSFRNFFNSSKRTYNTTKDKVFNVLAKIFWFPIWIFIIFPIRFIKKLKDKKKT